MSLIAALKLFNIACFLGYGVSCLSTQKMKDEFVRYGLARFRPLTGWLQIAGSLGLLAGFHFELLVPLASFGLSALMLLGVAVRVRLRDPIVEILPAFIFMCLNFYIFINWIAS
jgi:hypothetical protein